MAAQETTVVVVLVAAAGAVFLALRPKTAPAAPEPKPDEKKDSSIGDALSGALGAVVGGLGQGIGGALKEAGSGIGKGVGQLAAKTLPQLGQRGSDVRNNLSKLEENVASLTPFGSGTEESRRKQRAKGDSRAFAEGALSNMEAWAAKAHATLSRADVESWTLSGAGVFNVWFAGNPTPYVFSPPPLAGGDSSSGAFNRLAWAAEPVVRSLGYFTQAGGRIASNFPLHEWPYGFDARNPFAGPDVWVGPTRADERLTAEQSPERQIERLAQLGKTVDKNKGALETLLGAAQT